MKQRMFWLTALAVLAISGVWGWNDTAAQAPSSSPSRNGTDGGQLPPNKFRSAVRGDSSAKAAPAKAAPAEPRGGEPRTAPQSASRIKVRPVNDEQADAPAKAAGEKPAADKPAADKASAAPLRLPLFEGWPKPDVALLITGRQNGYIEPCGCTGLANQKGGLSRRMSLVADLQKRGWTLVPVDAGNQVKRFGRQSEIKFQIAFEGLKLMDYQAIGLGPDDVRLSSGEIFSAISDQPSRFVSANVAVIDRDLLPRSVAIEANGRRIGVTSVVADEFREKVRGSDEVLFTGAVDGIRTAWAQLQREKCDFHVLMVYGSLADANRFALQFPQFNVVVTTGGGEEPPLEPEPIPNSNSRTVVVPVGGKGMFVGVLGYYKGEDPPFRYQRVPLDDRFGDSPQMLELLAAYQDQLQNAGLDGLGVKPQTHPSGRSFVGSEKCGECHTKAYEAFQGTAHAHSLESLTNPKERSAIPRHYDPECLSCHVTGWDPQRYVPYKSGYLSLKATPAMVNNGCENCHGPGSAHVAAEAGETKVTKSQMTTLRTEMRLPLSKARDKCVECHDQDNSPAFQKEGAFARYWEQVEHKGKD
ncbi:MAG: cytochrome c family protein [Pirellulales bacterium]